MQSGALRDWLDFDRATATVDAYGQSTEAWTPVDPGSWGKVTFKGGGEAPAGPFGERGEVRATAAISYRPDLDGTGDGLRVRWAGRTFDVVFVEWIGAAEGLRLHMVERS